MMLGTGPVLKQRGVQASGEFHSTLCRIKSGAAGLSSSPLLFLSPLASLSAARPTLMHVTFSNFSYETYITLFDSKMRTDERPRRAGGQT